MSSISEEINWNALLDKVEAWERLEADRSEKVEKSVKQTAAFCDELEAGIYANAQDLGMIDPITREVDPDTVTNKVVGIATGESAKENAMSRVISEARAKVEDAAAFDPPKRRFSNLGEALQADLPDTQYLIKDMAIENGNVLLAAQYKSGKSTLMFNLIKAMCDGTPFLGYDVRQITKGKSVTYWDFELDEAYSLGELDKLGIEHPENATILNARGHTMPLNTDRAKEWAIQELKNSNTEVWIIDPFAAMFTGDENSNQEVGAYLRSLDEIKRRAGVKELFLVTHTGRTEGTTRARGATRLDDWADVRWTWEKCSGTEDRKKLSAHGRGVDQAAIVVEYDYTTNGYTVVDVDALQVVAKAQKTDVLCSSIIQFISAHPDCNSNEIVVGVIGRATDIRSGLKDLISEGIVSTDKVGQSVLHKVVPLVSNHSY